MTLGATAATEAEGLGVMVVMLAVMAVLGMGTRRAVSTDPGLSAAPTDAAHSSSSTLPTVVSVPTVAVPTAPLPTGRGLPPPPLVVANPRRIMPGAFGAMAAAARTTKLRILRTGWVLAL